jgi:PAS domain S-box-containing protein
MLHSLGAVGLLYAGIFAISGVVCLAAIERARKFDDPDVRRGLVWLLATAGGWSLLKTAFFVFPDPFRRAAYIAGLVLGFGSVWAWLYFCAAYTGRDYHRNPALRRLGAAVFLVVVSVKVTNPLHGAYFSTMEVTTPFAHLAIEHNALHWTATGLSYVLSAVGLFLIFQSYMDSGYDTRPVGGLTALLALPVVLDIGALFTPWLLEVIYAPIGVAAFSIGVLYVFDRRFLAIQRSARGDDLSIYLDDRGYVRDYSTAVEAVLPELADSTGDHLSDVVPAVADALDGTDQIIEREHSDDPRYYFVSESTVTLGDRGARLVQLSDVSETERQRRELVERKRELDEQNELYRAIIDASFAFIFRIDLEGQFTFVSASAEEFLGYSLTELESQPITVTLPDEATTERAWQGIGPILKGDSNLVRDFPLETKAGTVVYTDIRGVPIYQGDVPPDERTPEDIVEIQLMVRDATERRQREGFISVINRILRHNLRNKMTVITGYAKSLETELGGDSAEKARTIGDTADQLLELSESAQQIEEFRQSSTELEPMDITPVVDRTVSKLVDQYPEASVTVNAPDTVVAETNRRLETALWEIVDNAAEHGGTPPSIDIDVSVDERQVAVVVTDNGPGLPEVEREVLESETETQMVHGQGLGLWLVYWVVRGLNGEIEATTRRDGTSVAIRLPAPS